LFHLVSHICNITACLFIQNGFTILQEFLALHCGDTPEKRDNDVVEHIFPVIPGLHEVAVLTKKVKERVQGTVDDPDVEIIPENLLLNPRFNQFPGKG
jgi:hypothetical protein